MRCRPVKRNLHHDKCPYSGWIRKNKCCCFCYSNEDEDDDDATGDYGGPDDADHAFVCVLMMALGMRIGMLRTATVVVVAASVVVSVTVAVICCV